MLQKISKITLTVSLLVCSVMIPVAALSDADTALLIGSHNKVQEKTAEKHVWQVAHLDATLRTGDSLRTGSASRAEVKYSDGTVTRLGPNSLMRINIKSSEKRTGIRLLVGKLWLKVTKGQGLLKIETPSAIASVLGTELLVTNDEKNVSHVTTLDGLVEVTANNGDKALVHPGEWVEIAPGKPMEKPTPFDWKALKKNEHLLLDDKFSPTKDDLKDKDNWK